MGWWLGRWRLRWRGRRLRFMDRETGSRRISGDTSGLAATASVTRRQEGHDGLRVRRRANQGDLFQLNSVQTLRLTFVGSISCIAAKKKPRLSFKRGRAFAASAVIALSISTSGCQVLPTAPYVQATCNSAFQEYTNTGSAGLPVCKGSPGEIPFNPVSESGVTTKVWNEYQRAKHRAEIRDWIVAGSILVLLVISGSTGGGGGESSGGGGGSGGGSGVGSGVGSGGGGYREPSTYIGGGGTQPGTI